MGTIHRRNIKDWVRFKDFQTLDLRKTEVDKLWRTICGEAHTEKLYNKWMAKPQDEIITEIVKYAGEKIDRVTTEKLISYWT